MEIIIHATSTGPLRNALDSFWKTVNVQNRPTRAQDWQPHVTITKTLRDQQGKRADLDENQVAQVGQIVSGAIAGLPHSIKVAPAISPLTSDFSQSRFEITCPGWVEVGRGIEAEVAKTLGLQCTAEIGLHLSVAWGTGYSHTFHSPLASNALESVPLDEDKWSIGLWTKIGQAWVPQLVVPW